MRIFMAYLSRRRRPVPAARPRGAQPDPSVSAACRFYGYPAPERAPVDWGELDVHFKLRRVLGEPA